MTKKTNNLSKRGKTEIFIYFFSECGINNIIKRGEI